MFAQTQLNENIVYDNYGTAFFVQKFHHILLLSSCSSPPASHKICKKDIHSPRKSTLPFLQTFVLQNCCTKKWTEKCLYNKCCFKSFVHNFLYNNYCTTFLVQQFVRKKIKNSVQDVFCFLLVVLCLHRTKYTKKDLHSLPTSTLIFWQKKLSVHIFFCKKSFVQKFL